MLYLLGGASRAGKSKLARRLVAERQIPYLSLDIVMMGFANGMPEFGLDPDASGIVRGEKLWPLLRAMAINVLETGVTYLFEGDLLLPKHAAELARLHRPEVRACFIGYTRISPEEKLRDIRNFGGGPNDWVEDSPDEEVLALIAEMLAFSRYLQQECAVHDIRYFDNSAGFVGTFEDAFQYLTAAASGSIRRE